MPELARDEQQNSAAARASAHAAEATDGKPRSRWSSHTTFLLASIGSAIGFGNVWRFPMMAYSYGGGAFMLPYLIALFFAAIPMVVLEFALGQRLQRGHVALVAHIAPRWEGLGWATVVGTFLSAQYYQTLLAYCLVYLVNAFRDPQPWAVEEAARSLSESSSSLDGAEASSGLQPGSGEAGGETEADAALAAVRSFWREEVLQVSSGVDETGGLVGPLCGWYALVWAVVCLGACDGASSIGALNKLLMPMPFAVLAAFFARAVTLPGAGAGIRTLFSPDFAAIWSPSIWVAAVSQLFFGVSAGLGTLTTYASYIHTYCTVCTYVHTIQAHSPPTRASRLQARPSAARPSSSLSPTRPSPSSPAAPSLAFSASSHTPPASRSSRSCSRDPLSPSRFSRSRWG